MTGTQLNTTLSELVDSFILDNYPEALDANQPDILSNATNRDEAIDSLINYIEHNREFI